MRKLFLVLVITFFLVSCTPNDSFKINGIDYNIEDGILTQLTKGKVTRIGIISDPEGNSENTIFFVKKFLDAKVHLIIITGDIANAFRNNFSDYQETINVLTAAAKSKLPILVLPGNHERKPIFYHSLATILQSSNNIINLATIRTLNLDGVDLVSLPGINNPKLTFNDGFIYTMNDIDIIKKNLHVLDDPIIFISHNPPRGTYKQGIDVTFSGANVGDPMITSFLEANKIPFSISGHIHESPGAINHNNTPVYPDTFSSSLRINPGSASEWKYLNGTDYAGLAIVLEIEKNKAKYIILKK